MMMGFVFENVVGFYFVVGCYFVIVDEIIFGDQILMYWVFDKFGESEEFLLFGDVIDGGYCCFVGLGGG